MEHNTDNGFKLKIYSFSELENKFGNILPNSIENAKKMINLDSYEDFNRIILDCSYVKFTYRQEDINNNTKWDILINNTEQFYNDISLNSITNNNIFSEDNGLIMYPVNFFNDINIAQGSYYYIFDAGVNNTVNILFEDPFNHNISLSTGLDDDIMTIMVSNNNNDWIPISYIWMHKSSQEDPIAVSGISPHVSSNNSWIKIKTVILCQKIKKYLKMYYSLNTIQPNSIDISFNKINKLKINYRYLKISYKTTGINNGHWKFYVFIYWHRKWFCYK